MDSDRDAWAVLSYYFPQGHLVRRIDPLGSGGGWSGSRLWKVERPEGRYCLRRWPEGHPTQERLRFIHRVLSHVVARGMTIVPAPVATPIRETFVEAGGHLWELAPWMPGEADFRRQPTRGRLQAAMEALARFHDYAADIESSQGEAPCLSERAAELAALGRGRMREIEAAVTQGRVAELDSRARRVIAASRSTITELEALTRIASQHQIPLQPAIRDIHHDHILFTGEAVSGIIDFGAMRIDTPLADIARLIGSLVGDDMGSRSFALDTYSKSRPLGDADRQLIELLDESGLVLSGLNWLKWIYLERREMGQMPPILRRLDDILMRLERTRKNKLL